MIKKMVVAILGSRYYHGIVQTHETVNAGIRSCYSIPVSLFIFGIAVSIARECNTGTRVLEYR